jgi:cysteinyl-tRNA synthetase
MIAGARVEVAPYKRNPMDFVLWKPSEGDQPGWDSPWGRGRPGWHIECSAMAHELLGESFDIHGGGNDLMFPHHENEIAQSCCAHPEGDFARYWLHNEMLQVEGKKMSKSLGNFFTVRDLLDQGIPGEVIRFVFLSTHYRKPMDWTAEKARSAEAKVKEYARILLTSHLSFSDESWSLHQTHEDYAPDAEVIAALADDLNTHLAITRLDALAKKAASDDANATNAFLGSLILLGIFNDLAAIARFGGPEAGLMDAFDLEGLEARLSALRMEAIETKDFSEVDQLKNSLTDAGLEVRMSKEAVSLIPGPDFNPAKLEALK